MEEAGDLLPSLVVLFVLGVTTQWIAWLIRIPAILLLLAVGTIAGSFLEFVRPEEVFHDLLLPIVSLSVGLILFEGGLNLRFDELRQTWRSLTGLLTIGVLVTWSLATLFGVYILRLELPVATLLGSVLVVTGPTVIGPLLRDIRPSGRVGVIAKWEGIVIDPLGAVLAVLVFNAIVPFTNGELDSVLWRSIYDLVMTLIVGTTCGVVPAVVLALLMRRFLLPDYLQNPVTLTLVLTSFATANHLQSEAGLLAVTVMGITLANSKRIDVSKIIEFKESIATLLISTLFIILSARVPFQSLVEIGWRGPAFAAVLILVVRPASVWLSTIGSGLSLAERGFLAWFAPRGIVAAAVASVFAIRMEEAGAPMVPATFWVIFLTVAVYGLTAPFVARRFGLAVADAQGILIAGANKTVREIASTLGPLGFHVTMVDTQFPRIRRATQAGLNGCFANVLSEEVLDLVDFGGIGKFIAMTANDQVNTLATVRFRELFGRSNVYQLKSNEVRPSYLETRWQNHMAGRTLFSDDLTHEKLNMMIEQGVKLQVLPSEYFLEKTTEKISSKTPDVSPSSDMIAAAVTPVAKLVAPAAATTDKPATIKESEKWWPLFIVDAKRLIVCSSDTKVTFRSGQKVVVLSRQKLEMPTSLIQKMAERIETPAPGAT